MKVRWLLVASLFMAMFAFSSVSSISAARGVITDVKAAVKGEEIYPSLHGVAEYKVFSGGGSSFAISIQGAQALRFQMLYISVDTATSPPPVNVCTLHIGANGNGSCLIETRRGEIVPTIGGEGEIHISTNPDPSVEENVGGGAFFDQG